MGTARLALVVAFSLLGCDALTPGVGASTRPGLGVACEPRIGCEDLTFVCVSNSCDAPGTCQEAPELGCEDNGALVCDCRNVTWLAGCLPPGVPMQGVGACEGEPPTIQSDGMIFVRPCPDIGSCADEEQCGDGLLGLTEECDDGGSSSGDGCSGECLVESGWVCSNGVPCQRTTSCGDGVRSTFELCDDGNTVDLDGCDGNCWVELGWQCPATGACEHIGPCGDGVVDFLEECDDGNTIDSDGCSYDCTELDPGWVCRVPGRACNPQCGDDVVTATEECDDGNLLAGDGCNTSCHLETNDCDAGACDPAVCGDSLPEGSEACDEGDDNDDLVYGGCTTRCAYGPYCGDGAIDTQAGEGCDLGDDNVALLYVPLSDVSGGDVGCTPACRLPSYCGDSVIDSAFGETCDDGANDGLSRCRTDCTFTVP